ncbi:MAG: dihydropteroate synthase [Caldisericia bacterium]|jgi:dihydropteroate synthase|nr:dihydropteroate synthase [Caldisericia bacterium]
MNYRVRELSLKDFEKEKILKDLDVHPVGISIMKDKMVLKLIKVEELDSRGANILKQECLSLGGDCAIPYHAYNLKNEKVDCIIIGTQAIYKKLIPKLKLQPFGLKIVAEEIEKIILGEKIKKTKIGNKIFEWGKRTYIMGIINLTPDSFSEDGLYGENLIDNAIGLATLMVEWGADLIDIGGESTRPGSTPISYEEERKRVIPVLKRLVKEIDVPISVDTYKPQIAKEALHIGASLINDTLALRYDKEMVEIISKYNVPVVLMHSIDGRGGKPPTENYYKDVIMDIIDFFNERINYALENGIKKENIILDPGIGFGKNLKHNLEIIKNISVFKNLGFPILLGPSRKSFIGELLNLPVYERLEGTIAASLKAVEEGVDILRVHDVKEIKRAVKVYDEFVRESYENIS